MLKKKVIYIADFSLPNKSAYTLHVLKICDAFSEFTKKSVELLIPYSDYKYTKNNLKKDFLLKKKIKIINFFFKKKKFNFLTRVFFSIKIYNYLKKDKLNHIVISRSIIPSLILAFFNIKNILEIHTELTGLTKKIYFLTKLKFIKKNLKFIFINDYLRKKFKVNKKKSIILFDAVDYRDFKKKNTKIIKNTCFYSGSFVEGKGLELIEKIAFKLPEINFHLYGNIKTISNRNNKKFCKNIIFKNFIPYGKLTKKIHNYKILLMPYQKKVGVLIKNTSVEKYFSPLKMFDYMAAGKIIIDSDLKVYRNILKNKFNSILLDPNDVNSWVKEIRKIFRSNNLNYIGKNAIRDSKNYQWKSRVEKIIKFNEKK